MIIQIILTIFEVIFIIAALISFSKGNSTFLFFIMFAFIMIIVKKLLEYGSVTNNVPTKNLDNNETHRPTI